MSLLETVSAQQVFPVESRGCQVERSKAGRGAAVVWGLSAGGRRLAGVCEGSLRENRSWVRGLGSAVVPWKTLRLTSCWGVRRSMSFGDVPTARSHTRMLHPSTVQSRGGPHPIQGLLGTRRPSGTHPHVRGDTADRRVQLDTFTSTRINRVLRSGK